MVTKEKKAPNVTPTPTPTPEPTVTVPTPTPTTTTKPNLVSKARKKTEGSDIQSEIADGQLTILFSHGEVIKITADMFPDFIRDFAMLHGFKQKLVDAAAKSKVAGASAPVEDKYTAVKTVYDNLLAGIWSAHGEGGSSQDGGLLFQALREISPDSTPDEIREMLAGLTPKEKDALRKDDEVAPIIARLKLAKSKPVASVNTKALLQGLKTRTHAAGAAGAAGE